MRRNGRQLDTAWAVRDHDRGPRLDAPVLGIAAMGRSLATAGTTTAKHAMKRVDRFLDNTGVNLQVAWGNLIATVVDGAQVIRPISTVHRPPFSHPGHRTITLANAKLPPPFPDIDAVMRLPCRDLHTLPWVTSRRHSGLNRRNWQTLGITQE